MYWTKIENLLHDTMGLNTASIGSSAVKTAVKVRMSVCNITDVKHYTEKLLFASNSELQELVEEVVVAETWFFRDSKPFEMLARFVKEEWLPSNPDKPIRILSLPCATGEEPYSIAITLIEAGLMPSQLKIDAFDISERNIKRCKTAHYRENSFRGVSSYIRDRFFNREQDNYYPDILIKAMVNFEVASVLDPVFINTQLAYDVVFCRNLLIYFDRETQAVAVEMLNKLLKQEGMLFVGHAETSLFSKKWFASHRYQKSFIVRKTNDDVSIKNKTVGITSAKNQNRSPNSPGVSKPKKNYIKKPQINNSVVTRPVTAICATSNKTLTPAVNKNLNSSENDLAQARQLADSGKLIEAETICIRYLESNKQVPEVYYLLAIIQLAIGDEQKSVQYFKNVIYLSPGHYEALMYLSTLLGEEGDELGATRYRERATRVKNKMDLKCDNI